MEIKIYFIHQSKPNRGTLEESNFSSVTVIFETPILFFTVAVIVASPAATGVTNPIFDTVATSGLEDTQEISNNLSS